MKQDLELECQDCGEIFKFTVKEQEFFEDKGFSTPKRCIRCRRIRKQAQLESDGKKNEAMGNRN